MAANVLNIKTCNEVLTKGLTLVGITEERQQSVCMKTNIEDFKAHYGSHPHVYAILWEVLQTTTLDDARLVNMNDKHFERFLIALYFCKCYPKEKELKRFGIQEQTAQKWVKFFVKKISALKPQFIQWPTIKEWDNVIFIISFDGVNFGLNEPTHETLHKDKQYFDRKKARLATHTR